VIFDLCLFSNPGTGSRPFPVFFFFFGRITSFFFPLYFFFAPPTIFSPTLAPPPPSMGTTTEIAFSLSPLSPGSSIALFCGFFSQLRFHTPVPLRNFFWTPTLIAGFPSFLPPFPRALIRSTSTRPGSWFHTVSPFPPTVLFPKRRFPLRIPTPANFFSSPLFFSLMEGKRSPLSSEPSHPGSSVPRSRFFPFYPLLGRCFEDPSLARPVSPPFSPSLRHSFFQPHLFQ